MGLRFNVYRQQLVDLYLIKGTKKDLSTSRPSSKSERSKHIRSSTGCKKYVTFIGLFKS